MTLVALHHFTSFSVCVGEAHEAFDGNFLTERKTFHKMSCQENVDSFKKTSNLDVFLVRNLRIPLSIIKLLSALIVNLLITLTLGN